MRPAFATAALGGFAGTLAMTLTMYIVAPMMGLTMDIAAMLGSLMGGSWIAGMLMHFVNGSLIFPAIYAYVLHDRLPGAALVKGITWGAILWLLAQAVVMPMMGGGLFSARMGGAMAVIGSLAGHVIYGALLGAIAGAGQRPEVAHA